MRCRQVAETPSKAALPPAATVSGARESAADHAAARTVAMRDAPNPGFPAPLTGRRLDFGGVPVAAFGGGVPAAAFGGPGRSLDGADRAFMEPRLGADFSRVRVHADRPAALSARALGARAFTVGRHVAFGGGAYAPGAQDGRRLLAHELAHVVQQDRADVAQVDRKVTRDATTTPLDQAAVDLLTDAELDAQIRLLRAFLAGHPGDARVTANVALMERAAALRQGRLSPAAAPAVPAVQGAAVPAAPSAAVPAPRATAPAQSAPAPLPPQVERSPGHQRLLAEIMGAHWAQAAETLNGYNVDAMRSVLADLHPRQVESLYLGAIANDRVGGAANVAVETLAASPGLADARRAVLASGLTMREVVDYVTLTHGDVMDRHGFLRYLKIKDLVRALPGSVLIHVMPAEATTIYIFPSGRQGTMADEKARVVAEFQPPSATGAGLSLGARALGASPETQQNVSKLGDNISDVALAAAPIAGGAAARARARSAPDTPQPRKPAAPGGGLVPPSPAAPAAGIPAIFPKGQAANDVTPPQSVPARQAAGAEGYEPRTFAGSGPQKPPGPDKPAPVQGFPPPGTKDPAPAQGGGFPPPGTKAPAPAQVAPVAPVAQPGSPGPGAATSTWTVDGLMTGSRFNATQRVVYRATVDKMAAAMKDGTFDWNGMDDPIIVDGRQNLLQGHHRVVAARLAGVPIPQSAIRVIGGDAGRDPRPWSSVTARSGEKP